MADAELTVDDFQLGAIIASGNASQIWEARDAAGQSFAMKLLLPDALKNPEQVNVLKHEAKVGQALDHPNFVRTFKFVKSKVHCYMVMELFKCPNLKQTLQSEPIAVQSRFARFAEQLCAGLGYMHDKGWLHHDLKPDNILFNKGSELKLIDFSLSMRRQGGLGKVFAGKVKIVQGTRSYIAPETIQKKYPTVQSDLYSLGVTLFEVLTGQPPFTGSNPNDLLRKHLATKPPEPSALNPNLTPEIDKVVLRMLAKKPAHRPKDMAEVSAELRSVKVFKVDPLELAAQAEAKLKADGGGLDSKSRLDSRADAARVAAGVAAPARPEARKPTAGALAAAAAHAARKQAQSPQPDAYPPGYQQPAAGWPGYAPQPGYWPQQYPATQAPAQPYYQYPQAEPPQYMPQPPYGSQYAPQAAYPEQPPAPAAAPPKAPQAPAAPTRPAAAQPASRPAAKPAPQYAAPGQGRSLDERHPTQQDVDPDDLPVMEDLPEVL